MCSKESTWVKYERSDIAIFKTKNYQLYCNLAVGRHWNDLVVVVLLDLTITLSTYYLATFPFTQWTVSSERGSSTWCLHEQYCLLCVVRISNSLHSATSLTNVPAHRLHLECTWRQEIIDLRRTEHELVWSNSLTTALLNCLMMTYQLFSCSCSEPSSPCVSRIVMPASLISLLMWVMSLLLWRWPTCSVVPEVNPHHRASLES